MKHARPSAPAPRARASSLAVRLPRIVGPLVGAVVLLAAFGPAPVQAAGTYYVATTGSNTASGSSTRPWRTLAKAAAAAPAGSVIRIRGGTYAGVTIKRPSLTFQRYGTTAVIVKGSSTYPSPIRVVGTHDIVLRGLTVQGATTRYSAGIYVDRSTRVTISGVTARYNHSFGVAIRSSSAVLVTSSNIYRNDTGIQISYGGAGVRILSNKIHHNDRMIVNDAAAYNDRGANGIVFYKTTGPITVQGNSIYSHRAASHDYGLDGGAFEIYAASGITIAGNRLYNNLNVLETGTDGSAGCNNISFVRNVAFGGPDGGQRSEGLVLRCMTNSLIANNTFADLTGFVYYMTSSGAFAGALNGLVIRNNIARQPNEKVYSLQTVPVGVSMDRNLAFNASGGAIAWVGGLGQTKSLATYRAWTGFETTGILAEPRFIDVGGYDFRLRLTSPAIDRGLVISPVTDGYRGSAPDLGRYES